MFGIVECNRVSKLVLDIRAERVYYGYTVIVNAIAMGYNMNQNQAIDGADVVQIEAFVGDEVVNAIITKVEARRILKFEHVKFTITAFSWKGTKVAVLCRYNGYMDVETVY